MNRETITELDSYLNARAAAEKALETCLATMEIHYRAVIADLTVKIDALTAEPTPTAPAAEVEEAPVPEIQIARQPRGHYSFRTPRKNAAFIAELKNYFRGAAPFWHIQREEWQIKPIDGEMLELIAKSLRKHFPGYVVVIDHAREVPIELQRQAFMDATPKVHGLGFLGAQPR